HTHTHTQTAHYCMGLLCFFFIHPLPHLSIFSLSPPPFHSLSPSLSLSLYSSTPPLSLSLSLIILVSFSTLLSLRVSLAWRLFEDEVEVVTRPRGRSARRSAHALAS